MVDGEEIDRKSRQLAKEMDEASSDDIELLKQLLARAAEIREEYSTWIEENADVSPE